jgi:hypothetical protein
MKNRFLTLLSALMLFSAVVVLNSCSKDDEDPANVITDGDGIRIELEWTTGGTVAEAKDEADLDLSVDTSDGDDVASSSSFSEFEAVNLGDLTDGEYIVNVYMFGVDASGDFTVRVEGLDVSDSFSFSGDFAADDDGDITEFLRITKSGDKYTIVKL